MEESAWCKDNGLLFCNSEEEFRPKSDFSDIFRESKFSETWKEEGLGEYSHRRARNVKGMDVYRARRRVFVL